MSPGRQRFGTPSRFRPISSLEYGKNWAALVCRPINYFLNIKRYKNKIVSVLIPEFGTDCPGRTWSDPHFRFCCCHHSYFCWHLTPSKAELWWCQRWGCHGPDLTRKADKFCTWFRWSFNRSKGVISIWTFQLTFSKNMVIWLFAFSSTFDPKALNLKLLVCC